MPSLPCLVEFSFVCPKCRRDNTRLTTARFVPDFAVRGSEGGIRLTCSHCGALAARMVVEELSGDQAGRDPRDFQDVELLELTSSE